MCQIRVLQYKKMSDKKWQQLSIWKIFLHKLSPSARPSKIFLKVIALYIKRRTDGQTYSPQFLKKTNKKIKSPLPIKSYQHQIPHHILTCMLYCACLTLLLWSGRWQLLQLLCGGFSFSIINNDNTEKRWASYTDACW